jgi:hypothetical protein
VPSLDSDEVAKVLLDKMGAKTENKSHKFFCTTIRPQSDPGLLYSCLIQSKPPPFSCSAEEE